MKLQPEEQERFDFLKHKGILNDQEIKEYNILRDKERFQEEEIPEPPKHDDVSNLTKLGSKETKYIYENPSYEMLETFLNQYPERDYVTQFVFDEFTSLCLAGETLIDVARNEIEFPKGIPIKDLVGTEGYVFSFDPHLNIPLVKKYHSVRKTRKNAKVIRVNLEHLHMDGKGNSSWEPKELIVTPDHLILVSNGWGKFSWIKAKNLKPGMRLIADQKDNDHIRGKARHRLILEEIYGRKLKKKEHGHHIDGNHYNNLPSNLEIKLQSKHCSDHRIEQYGYSESLDIEELVNLYNSGRENFHSLAKKIGCDVSTIESRIGNLVDKRRTQKESLLSKPKSIALHKVMKECKEFYEQGYTTYELSEFYGVHDTTISTWIRTEGGKIRTSLETKELRKTVILNGLNHKVISIESAGEMDVYNMEVEETACFFANGVVVHNCPKTGQPDFAKVTVEYIADKLCIETKSLKVYFLAYRQERTFMETLTNRILEDCVKVCQPRQMRVISNFNARGGTFINVIAEYKKE